MRHKHWKDEEANATYLDGRISIYAKPSMVADDGTVAVGIEAPWIEELWDLAEPSPRDEL